MTTRLVLATRNAGKLAELQRLLSGAVPGVTVVGLRDVPEYPEAPETGATFAENALLKAREAVRYTGLPAVADDSGLTVDALNGMPGIFSARWSGRHGDDDANTALLLGQLTDVPDERRGGAFVCAAALVTPEGAEHVLRAEWRGAVLREPRGTNGFGYDPVFLPAGSARTAAITGAYVALADAVAWLDMRSKLAKKAIATSVAAVSVGVIDGEPRLDLAYEEDVRAGTDMNVVCTGDGGFVEVQGTAEGAVFDRSTLDALLDLAVAGCAELTRVQQEALSR